MHTHLSPAVHRLGRLPAAAILALFCVLSCATAQEAAPEPTKPRLPVPPVDPADRPPEDAPRKPGKIVQLSKTRFRIDQIEIDNGKRTITFPAAVNMDTGMLEYALTTETGKTHESLLRTAIQPIDLNVAILLLRYKVAVNFFPPAFTPVERRPPPGTPPCVPDHTNSCDIKIAWKDKDGKSQSAYIEDWIYNAETKKSAKRAPWVYTGSEANSNGVWAAQVTGSIVATFTDPLAMLNNPRAGAKSDEIWIVAKDVPPVNTPVQVTFLPHQKEKTGSAAKSGE